MTRWTRFSELHKGAWEFGQRTPTLTGQALVRLPGVRVSCRWSSVLGSQQMEPPRVFGALHCLGSVAACQPLPWPLALEVSAAVSLLQSCYSPGEQAAGRKRGAWLCSHSPLPVLGPRPMGLRAPCPATPSLPSAELCPPRQRLGGLGSGAEARWRQAADSQSRGGGRPAPALGQVQPSAVSVNSFIGTWPRPFVQILSSIN